MLLSRLSASSSETTSAASHRASIEASLKSGFGMTSLFRSGSFGHQTSVRWYSDVDYFAVIPRANLKKNSTQSLQAIRSTLHARFPRTGVTVRSPAVIVPFGSQPGERHEIVPADYVRQSTGGFNIYDIPDRAGGWMRSSPQGHNAWVNMHNNNLNKKLKPLIRLIKAWNYYNTVGIRSFYLELRTTEYAKNESVIIYKIDFLSCLRAIRRSELASMQDPMGVSGLVAPATAAIKTSAISKLDTAIRRAEKAREEENANNMPMAIFWWNLVFNDWFPKWDA